MAKRGPSSSFRGTLQPRAFRSVATDPHADARRRFQAVGSLTSQPIQPVDRGTKPRDGYVVPRKSPYGRPSRSHPSRRVPDPRSSMARGTPEETNVSPTIRSLVIPVSDLDAAKAGYTALFG